MKKKVTVSEGQAEVFKVDGDFVVRVKNGQAHVIPQTHCFIHMDKEEPGVAKDLKYTLEQDDRDFLNHKDGKFVSVVMSTTQDSKPIHWIENKSVSVRELFPHWMTADIILTDFVKKTGGWIVESKQSNVNATLKFPMVWGEASGCMVPMFEIFPPEDRFKVDGICHGVLADYAPSWKHHLREKITEPRLHMIQSEIKSRECEIISQGGRPVKEELAFRLGIWAIHNVEIWGTT